MTTHPIYKELHEVTITRKEEASGLLALYEAYKKNWQYYQLRLDEYNKLSGIKKMLTKKPKYS